MSNTNMDAPAFPRDHAHSGHNGMTLRDYFAIRATEEDIKRFRCTGRTVEKVVTGFQGQKRVLRKAETLSRERARYAFADAMLRAREAT